MTGQIQDIKQGLIPPEDALTVTMSIARLAVTVMHVKDMENMTLQQVLHAAGQVIEEDGYEFPYSDNTLCCAALQATMDSGSDAKPFWKEDAQCVPFVTT